MNVNADAVCPEQSGAVLITVLVLVAIIGLASLSAMDTTVLELRMSNNTQQQIEAMNIAEEAMISAEKEIDEWVVDGLPAFDNAQGPYFDSSDEFTILPDSPLWKNDYMVEYLGYVEHEGESIREESEPDSVQDITEYFRIYARSGEDGFANREILTIYSTEEMGF